MSPLTIIVTLLAVLAALSLAAALFYEYISLSEDQRRQKCPHCGKRNSIPIMYGYPSPGAILISPRLLRLSFACESWGKLR